MRTAARKAISASRRIGVLLPSGLQNALSSSALSAIKAAAEEHHGVYHMQTAAAAASFHIFRHCDAYCNRPALSSIGVNSAWRARWGSLHMEVPDGRARLMRVGIRNQNRVPPSADRGENTSSRKRFAIRFSSSAAPRRYPSKPGNGINA